MVNEKIIPIEPLIGGLRQALCCTDDRNHRDYSIEPLIGGLRQNSGKVFFHIPFLLFLLNPL